MDAFLNSNLLLTSAMELASFGLKVMPLHSVDPRGRCSCGCQKSTCKSRGKHPRIQNWQRDASSDEDTIGAWWGKWPLANVGVQWGPRSNAIDIEFDNEEGRASADRLMGSIVTPSYQSGRSIHRIFRYLPLFDGFGATKRGETVEHLEYRIGADSKGAQSVAPPSRHYSGRLYSWLRGLRISEVEIADPPAGLIEVILRSRQSIIHDSRKKKALPLSDRIAHGNRQLALVSLAGTMRRRGLVKEEILPSLQAVYARRCEQVAGDDIDLEKIAESICKYEPTSPLLQNDKSLVAFLHEDSLKHLPPAIRRARAHALEHRMKRGRA